MSPRTAPADDANQFAQVESSDAAEQHGGDHGADYTTVLRADVYKDGQLAAHLERTDTGVAYSYTKEWVSNGGIPVATTLPVGYEPVVVPGGAVPAYFAGLLPEGRRLSALRRNVKTSTDDELSLVLAIGADPVGDVQILPADWPLNETQALLQVRDFSDVRFADLLAQLDIRVDRVGLAGVQDKVSLAMLSLPVLAAGDKYLLKLNPPEYKHLVENEHFFLNHARQSGLVTAESEIVLDRDGSSGLAVRRFDRVARAEGSRRTEQRLAVEDGCQALGLHPEAKYRLSTEEVLGRLCALSEAPVIAARTFLSQIVFAYVTGNGDAHAKNFSILANQPGRWAPSPAYDLPSSQPYGDSTMALSIANTRDGVIPGSRFVTLGEQLGLPPRAARSVVHGVATAVGEWIDEVLDLPFDPGVSTKLRNVMRRRQSFLLNNQ